MYIQINGAQFPCADYRASPGLGASFVGVEGLPVPVTGEISLHADDGFEMARQDAGAYARQTYEGGVLTLTNEPVPEPAEPPEPPGPTYEERIAELEALNAMLMATVDAIISEILPAIAGI